MAMIACPECGTRISDSSISCPYCGFKLSKKALAKTEKTNLSDVRKEALAFFASDSVEEMYMTREQADTIEKIFSIFRDAKKLLKVSPALVETIKSLYPDTQLVADITSKMQEMIESGKYRILLDKNNELCATIVDEKNQFVKNIRLREMNFSPDILPAINNLQTQMVLAEILYSVEDIKNTLSSIKVDIQDDRMALAESVTHQLMQAEYIKDSRIREAKLLEITSKATDARILLSKSINRQTEYLINIWNKDKSSLLQGSLAELRDVADAFRGESGVKNGKAAEDVFSSFFAMLQCAKTEIAAYNILGEQKAAAEVMAQLKDFIEKRRLNDTEGLKIINSFSQKDFTPLIEKCRAFCQLYSEKKIDNLLPEKNVLLISMNKRIPATIN